MTQPESTNPSCAPCQGGVPPMTKEAAQQALTQIPGWQLNEAGTELTRTFVMKDFMEAVRFIQRIAALAEARQHHPDLHLTRYRVLTVNIQTHKINGLTEHDFALAADINQALKDFALKENA